MKQRRTKLNIDGIYISSKSYYKESDMSGLDWKVFIPKWMDSIHFAFSCKRDGQMSFKRDDVAFVAENRNRFLNKYNLDLKRIVGGELVHGKNIEIVTDTDAGRGSVIRDWFEGVDGFVTSETNVLLLTTHADCAPVIIFDPVKKVLGQAHAGWKGLAAGIIEELVAKLVSLKNSHLHDIMVWIGPTIGQCCYPVSETTAMRFPANCISKINDKPHLSLAKFIYGQLFELGVSSTNISDAGVCTSCIKEFSSYRRDGAGFYAMACVSGLK